IFIAPVKVASVVKVLQPASASSRQGSGSVPPLPAGHPSPPLPPATPAVFGQSSTELLNASPSQLNVPQFGLSASHLFGVPSLSQSAAGSFRSQEGPPPFPPPIEP